MYFPLIRNKVVTFIKKELFGKRGGTQAAPYLIGCTFFEGVLQKRKQRALGC